MLTDQANGGCNTVAKPGSSASCQHKDDNSIYGWLDNTETAWLCCCMLLLITRYTVVFFPIYYVQQTCHRTVSVFNSFGLLVHAGDMYLAGVLNS